MNQLKSTVNFPLAIKKGIWIFGTSCWLFGVSDRILASLADGYLSAIDIIQLFTTSFFLVSWLFLKPE
ncbi:MAG: hypothetical protein IGS23_25280 [Rivularia sp. T60_A2020_040]|nr:hypothetical protein [Rivularia sp. T60_A2020_040]